ncbi:Uncharacterised protein [Plesiomonas shigelloides]|nr:Uncharacterised protein [Plesiomonas shigelloides]
MIMILFPMEVRFSFVALNKPISDNSPAFVGFLFVRDETEMYDILCIKPVHTASPLRGAVCDWFRGSPPPKPLASTAKIRTLGAKLSQRILHGKAHQRIKSDSPKRSISGYLNAVTVRIWPSGYEPLA